TCIAALPLSRFGKRTVCVVRVAVQLPRGVPRGAAHHVLDIRGIRRRTAAEEKRYVPTRHGGIRRRGKHRPPGGWRTPGAASVRTGIGIESTDQGRCVGGILIEVVH